MTHPKFKDQTDTYQHINHYHKYILYFTVSPLSCPSSYIFNSLVPLYFVRDIFFQLTFQPLLFSSSMSNMLFNNFIEFIILFLAFSISEFISTPFKICQITFQSITFSANILYLIFCLFEDDRLNCFKFQYLKSLWACFLSLMFLLFLIYVFLSADTWFFDSVPDICILKKYLWS